MKPAVPSDPASRSLTLPLTLPLSALLSRLRHGRPYPPRPNRSSRGPDRSLARCPQPGVHRNGE
jgi:hypothetical protein